MYPHKFSYFSQVEPNQEPSIPVRAVAGAALGGTLGAGAALLGIDKYEKYRNRIKPLANAVPNWKRRGLIGAGLALTAAGGVEAAKTVDRLQTKIDMLQSRAGIPIPQTLEAPFNLQTRDIMEKMARTNETIRDSIGANMINTNRIQKLKDFNEYAKTLPESTPQELQEGLEKLRDLQLQKLPSYLLEKNRPF